MTPNGSNPISHTGPFQGRHIGVGITGGIAAYKMCHVVSQLTQSGAVVDVLMTLNAQRFVGEATFQALSGRPVLCDPWEGPDPSDPQHIRVARRLELLLIAPASMNTIGRLAHGITEDVITLTAAGIPPRSIPRILAPSMNAAMWSQASTQRNLKLLKDDGWLVVPPDEGMQACQTNGLGRLPEPESLLKVIADRSSVIRVSGWPRAEEWQKIADRHKSVSAAGGWLIAFGMRDVPRERKAFTYAAVKSILQIPLLTVICMIFGSGSKRESHWIILGPC